MVTETNDGTESTTTLIAEIGGALIAHHGVATLCPFDQDLTLWATLAVGNVPFVACFRPLLEQAITFSVVFARCSFVPWRLAIEAPLKRARLTRDHVLVRSGFSLLPRLRLERFDVAALRDQTAVRTRLLAKTSLVTEPKSLVLVLHVVGQQVTENVVSIKWFTATGSRTENVSTTLRDIDRYHGVRAASTNFCATAFRC